jgi:3-deoxy-D-manno-octulosonate 8-phosphate phosphatase (KDO 8-P phosphatase)
MPSHLPLDVRARLEPIRLLVLDVDGVLTDGSLLYGADGEHLKAFSVRDGLGIRLLLQSGIQVAVITGRSSAAVRARCEDLGVRSDLVVLGSKDKDADLDRVEGLLEITDASQVAAVGDDLPDLPMLARAGLAACPADAAPEVAAACDLVLGSAGGHGAVREVAQLILKAQRLWMDRVGDWLATGREGP